MKLEQLLEGVPYTLVQGSLELDIEDMILLDFYRMTLIFSCM